MYKHLDYVETMDMYTHLDYDKTVDRYTHLDYDKTGHVYTFRLLGTGKRYLRVYIQIRFRHACHETRDRQSRSLVSGQEEGWGEVKVLLKF